MKNELKAFMREVAEFIENLAKARKPFDDFYTSGSFEAVISFKHPRIGTVKVFHGDRIILSDTYIVE